MSGLLEKIFGEPTKPQEGVDYLIPPLNPFTMPLYTQIFLNYGFDAIEVRDISYEAIDRGLEVVPTEMCGPATAVAGAFIQYDHDHPAKPGTRHEAFITATGGPCRASNYAMVIGSGMQKAGVDIPLNLLGLVPGGIDAIGTAKNFVPSMLMFAELAKATIIGDTIQQCVLATRPYEAVEGQTDAMCTQVIEMVRSRQKAMSGWGLFNTKGYREYRRILRDVVRRFDSIERRKDAAPKPKTLVVGEIFANYQEDFNYHIVDRLEDNGREVELPDMMNFFLQSFTGNIYRRKAYHTSRVLSGISRLGIALVENRYRKPARRALGASLHFDPHPLFKEIYKDKMIRGEWTGGEGPLLSAEMVSGIKHGINDIVIIQPYDCLAGKIAGQAPILPIKERYPKANIRLVERRAEDLEGTNLLSRAVGMGAVD